MSDGLQNGYADFSRADSVPALLSEAVATPRRRGKSLARRIYQAGSVHQQTASKEWDAEKPAYGRYWADIPGGGRRRVVISLGVCRTRSVAQRKCAEEIERLGVNSTAHFVETTASTTFRQQAEAWLKSLETRKRNPVEETTVDTRRYALDKWIYPQIGETHLADVTNLTLKTLVDKMAGSRLSASTIRDYSNIVKWVVASAIDERGEEKFPRKWNAEFIDAPVIGDQNQPTTTGTGMRRILDTTAGRYRVLYALLAGCGPLRAGEALGLEIDKHISEDFRTLQITQKAKRGVIQDHLKTENGERRVDLCSSLARMLREFVGKRQEGLLFCTSSGKQILQSNALRDSLHPVLETIGHAKGGFNIFRRFRLTHVDKSGCPPELRRFWSGHAQNHVEQRYIKLLGDRDFRLEWAERIGLGFDLPTGNVGIYGIESKVVEFRRSA